MKTKIVMLMLDKVVVNKIILAASFWSPPKFPASVNVNKAVESPKIV